MAPPSDPAPRITAALAALRSPIVAGYESLSVHRRADEGLVLADAVDAELPVVLAEIQRCWAELYAHSLYTFYEPSTGVALPLCWYCRRYETSGYCDERHKQALKKGASHAAD